MRSVFGVNRKTYLMSLFTPFHNNDRCQCFSLVKLKSGLLCKCIASIFRHCSFIIGEMDTIKWEQSDGYLKNSRNKEL